MNDITELETQAREILARSGWYPRALAADAWPLTTAQVCGVLTGVGFAVNPDKLFEFQSRGVAPVPSEWTAAELIGLANLLEARRDWLPGFHETKKTPWQIRLEQCREAGTSATLAEEFKLLDIRHALVLLTEAANPQQREQLFVVVQAILEEHGITV